MQVERTQAVTDINQGSSCKKSFYQNGSREMRIAICDDEKSVQEILAEKVNRFCPGAKVRCYSSGRELLEAEETPDILFLDIQMPDLDGMETAEQFREKNKRTVLIFVTAVEDYVFRAFDVGAFHYLVKPFEEQKFASVLESAVERCRQSAESSSAPKGREEEKHILILSNGNYVKIRLRDIVYAEVFNRKVVIHKMAEDIEYYGKLSDLEKLAGRDFFRCHRSFLVNFRYVERYDGAMIMLEKGTVPIAKKNYPAFVKSYLHYNLRTGSEEAR